MERLRGALAARVESSGLRPVAREVGMDPRGITKLLQGARPRQSTLQKLERWYVRRIAEADNPTGVEDARAALAVLMYDVPPAARPQAVRETSAFLEVLYKRMRVPIPTWLSDLRATTPPNGR